MKAGANFIWVMIFALRCTLMQSNKNMHQQVEAIKESHFLNVLYWSISVVETVKQTRVETLNLN
jgi:hypothetical protein